MSKSEGAVDRNTLYEQVWSEPVTAVAKRYGLSDVGLAKICKKLAIPLPSRGYWAKVAAGKVMRKVALPPMPASMQSSAGPVPLSNEETTRRAAVREAVARVLEAQPEIHVADGEGRSTSHPLVAVAAQHLKRRDGWGDPAGLRSAPGDVLHVAATRESLDRALRIADALLKALEAAGISVRIDREKAKTVLDSDGTAIWLSITERIDRSAHTLTRAEERAQKRYFESWRTGERVEPPEIPRYDFAATGRLTIAAGRYPERHWNDTARTSLEDRMPEVIAGIVALVEKLRTEDAERARREEARRLARVHYEQAVKRRHDERLRMRGLQRDAARFRRARALREYIDAVEALALASGDLPVQTQEWVACGARQGSCRLVHAARRRLSVSSVLAVTTESRSGLRVTAPMGAQLRVAPDQRAGFCARAVRYNA